MKNQLPGNGIKHVVVLMLENRGFDHLMGWLYSPAEATGEADDPPPLLSGDPQDQRRFLGLSTMSEDELQALANLAPGQGNRFQINPGARSPKTPSYNTGESFQHIMNQCWSVGQPDDVWFDPATRQHLMGTLEEREWPKMLGYVLDYQIDVKHEAGVVLDREGLSEVMDTYLPQQVPVLSGLARTYAVSDEWYCSVPSQTNTNRAFVLSGTSRGLVNNSFYDPVTENPVIKAWRKIAGGKTHCDELPVSTRCLFEVLEQAGYAWRVYWQSSWPPEEFAWQSKWAPAKYQMDKIWRYTRNMFPFLTNKQFDDNFVLFDGSDPDSRFFQDARDGRLPAFTWIEPKWGGGKSWEFKLRMVGNDMHPVSDTTVAEDFVARVYEALTKSDAWKDTLLVITFDENGGTYDHMFPPEALPSGTDACPLPHPDIGMQGMDPTTKTQFGYDFKQLGVRVPTLLISPRGPMRTLFRSPDMANPFDHTSLIATVLKMAEIPPENWLLGDRVANAATFEHLFLQGDHVPHVRAADALKTPPLPDPDNPQAPPGAQLIYGQPYVLQYVGEIWNSGPADTYLGKSESGRMWAYWYPTFVDDRAAALGFTLLPAKPSDDGNPVNNMDLLCIRTPEWAPLGNSLLTVSHLNANVYYDSKRDSPAAQWQVRILSSRDKGDPVRVGDYVYFVSQLPPNAIQQKSQRFMPDPLQRLMPDPTAPKYGTTIAGEWGLWRVLPPNQPA